MREIKFRAWDKRTNQMFSVREMFWLVGGLQVDDGATTQRGFAPQDFDIMQYTGLKDSKGVEIYEGDIVRYNHSTPEYGFPLKYKGAVEWFDGYTPKGNNAKFHINNRFDKGQDIIWHEIEVIGNIYENPELLEKK